MRFAFKNLTLFFIPFVVHSWCTAQGPNVSGTLCRIDLPLEEITVNDGLSQGMVSCFSKNKDGFLWIGTKDGLNRYDGYEFKVLRMHETDSNTIVGNYIVEVCEDMDGMIWIGTMQSGITRYNPFTGKFIKLSDAQNINDRLSSKSIRKILVDTHRNIWVSTSRGIDLLIPAVRSAENVQFSVHHLSTLIPDMPEDAFDVQYWRFLTSGELEIYARNKIITVTQPSDVHRISSSTTSLNRFCAFDDDRVHPVFDQQNNLTFFLSKSGITVFDQKTDTMKQSYPVPIELRDFPDALLDHKGRLWLKTEYGMCLYTVASNTLCRVASRNKKVEAERFDNYFSAYKDSDGTLWFGTFGYGVLKYVPENERFSLISNYHQSKTSISGIFETPAQEVVAQAYQQNDPILCDLDRNIFVKPFVQLSRIEYNLRNSNSIAFDDDKIFIGYAHLFSVSSTDGSRIPFPLNRAKDGLPDIIYDPLYIDQQGRLWCANGYPSGQKELFELDKNSGQIIRTFAFPDADFHHEYRFVSDWLEDGDGNFWFGTLRGVYFFNTDLLEWRRFSIKTDIKTESEQEVVFSICFDENTAGQILWVGTNGFGLKKLNVMTGRIDTTYRSGNGLPNDVIYGIECDDRHNLWLSTNNGLCLFNPVSGETQNFTEADGLQSAEFNRYAHLEMQDGTMLFGGVNGINVFHPNEFYIDKRGANALITNFKVFNKPVQPGEALSKRVIFNTPLEYTRNITLMHDVSMLTLSFALTDLSNPVANKFKYKLTGFGDKWIDGGTINEATFTNLHPGDYTFEVIGSNGYDIWSQSPATLHITILPPWWGTWWFRSIVILLFAASIYAFYRYRLQQALKLQHLRNRIATDLHDEIGSTLSSISLAGTVIRKKLEGSAPEVESLISGISQNTDSMMEAMSDIVWAVNTKNDRFDNVVNRMRAFAVELLEPKDILLHFTIDSNVKHLQLDMQQRKNLYLIFKEAINNAAKYACCKNVWVDIAMKNGRVTTRIRDDGKGFELNDDRKPSDPSASDSGAKPTFGGNGLGNMQQRANELKGKLRIDSTVGQGTEVEVVFVV